jgi:hypothetical protein
MHMNDNAIAIDSTAGAGAWAVYFLRGEPGQFTELVKAQAAGGAVGTQVSASADAPTRIPARARSAPPLSQELRETQAGVRRGGHPVAPRIIDAALWWQYFERSAAHNACSSVKARDVVGGGFVVDSPERGPAVPPAVLDDIGERIDASLENIADACRDWEVTGWIGLECQPAQDRARLYKLNHIDSWTLWPRLDGRGYVHARDQRAAEFVPLGAVDPRRNMLAWLNNNHWFRSSYYGVPDIVSVLLQIETAWQALRYNLDFFARRGGYRWMLLLESPPGSLSPDAGSDAKLIRQINYTTRQVGKDSDADLVSIPIGSRKATLQRLDAEVQDLDFGALLERYRNDILLAHSVPPLKVGIVETGALGGNVGQEQLRAYRDNVVAPKQRRWNRFLREIIRVWWGVDVRFAFRPVELDEFALLAPQVVSLVGADVITREEARAILGLKS